MRNGAVADYMRRMGAPYKIIFGVNLPHLSEIASETVPSQELARQLWANSSTRESMLLAPMIFRRALHKTAQALAVCKDVGRRINSKRHRHEPLHGIAAHVQSAARGQG